MNVRLLSSLIVGVSLIMAAVILSGVVYAQIGNVALNAGECRVNSKGFSWVQNGKTNALWIDGTNLMCRINDTNGVVWTP